MQPDAAVCSSGGAFAGKAFEAMTPNVFCDAEREKALETHRHGTPERPNLHVLDIYYAFY